MTAETHDNRLLLTLIKFQQYLLHNLQSLSLHSQARTTAILFAKNSDDNGVEGQMQQALSVETVVELEEKNRLHNTQEWLNSQLCSTATTKTALALLIMGTATLFSPTAAQAGDAKQGEVLFVNNCAACHRGGQNIMKPAKTLQEADLVKYLGSADQATLATFFSKSMQHKLMSFPNVPGGKLSETDVVDVTSYISNQATGNLWK